MRASEILALAVKARGRRRWPVDSAARTGNPAAVRPATAARRGSVPAARPAGRPAGAHLYLPRALSARANTSSTVPTASTVLRSAL
jgi:hypothetical protein